MSWVSVAPPADHGCQLPTPVDERNGSVWQCDECGARWTLWSKRIPNRPPDPAFVSAVYRQKHGPDGSHWVQKRRRFFQRKALAA